MPKVFDKKLFICPFKKGDKLEKSCFNVNEPCTSPVDPNVLDLVIVPALMVDKNGYRLGYGGGFYDIAFFSYNPFMITLSFKQGENSFIKTIVPIPKELFVEKLPVEIFDKKIDVVITL